MKRYLVVGAFGKVWWNLNFDCEEGAQTYLWQETMRNLSVCGCELQVKVLHIVTEDSCMINNLCTEE